MVSRRYEVRLDPERREKLTYLASQRQTPVSETIRRMIDEAYDEAMLEYRLDLVRRIAEAEIEDVPDPQELSRQLDATHDIPDPYRHQHTGVRRRARPPAKGTSTGRSRTSRS
jgi:predicted DNA-binding protein